jgi:hypothetical protein
VGASAGRTGSGDHGGPLPGMLLHIDGSEHRWFHDDRWYDLLVILDDASSEIYYAQLVEEESTLTVMAALKEVIERQGLFCALYSDRGSQLQIAGGTGDKGAPPLRCCELKAAIELGEIARSRRKRFASSSVVHPQFKRRIFRAHRKNTIQDPLPLQLRNGARMHCLGIRRHILRNELPALCKLLTQSAGVDAGIGLLERTPFHICRVKKRTN